MAKLLRPEILQKVKKRKKKSEILEAEDKKIRLNFHSQLYFRNENNIGYDKFFKRIATVLKDDSTIDKFKAIYSQSKITHDLLTRVDKKLKRAFEGKDRSFEVKIKSEGDSPRVYLNQIGLHKMFKTVGWDKYKNSPDDLMLVDMPPEISMSPDAYLNFIDVCSIVNYEIVKYDQWNENTTDNLFNFIWIIFELSKDTFVYADDYEYVVIQKKGDNYFIDDMRSSVHDLGYTPVKSLVIDPQRSDSDILKSTPYVSVIDDLDNLLFWSLCKEYLDQYGPFPIYAVYESRCDYKDPVSGAKCDGEGTIFKKEFREDGSTYTIDTPCPSCRNKLKPGPGHYIELPMPRQQEQSDPLRNPIQVIQIERDQLDYLTEKVEKKERSIYVSLTGDTGTGNDTAKNETQILQGVSTQEDILKDVAKTFEYAEQWATETILKLKYNKFDVVNINYGTDFYFKTPEQILEEIEKAKEAGLSITEIERMKDTFYDTKLQTDPVQRRKIKIINMLDPFPGMTLEDIKDFRGTSILNTVDISKKLYLQAWVNKWESENEANIGSYGIDSTNQKKIMQDLITDFDDFINTKSVTPN